MLKPSYRKKKMEEMGLTEDDYYKGYFIPKGTSLPLYWSKSLGNTILNNTTS